MRSECEGVSVPLPLQPHWKAVRAAGLTAAALLRNLPGSRGLSSNSSPSQASLLDPASYRATSRGQSGENAGPLSHSRNTLLSDNPLGCRKIIPLWLRLSLVIMTIINN